MWKMVKKQGEMEQQIEGVKSQMNGMQQKMEKIGDDVISSALLSGWKYYGRGTWGSEDASISKHSTTFPQCVQMCENQRTNHGSGWNGMIWRPSDGFCECYKNDQGHDSGYPTWMHFKTN